MSDELDAMFRKECVSDMRGMFDVTVRRDVPYCQSGGEQLCLDAYLPEVESATLCPVVLLVHGEAPFESLKDAGQYTSLARMLASYGIAAVVCNRRRLLAGSTVDEVIESLIAARDFIDGHAQSLRIDHRRIGIWSFSAGMPFGFHNALQYRPEQVACVVGYYGLGDFETLMQFISPKEHRPVAPTILPPEAIRSAIMIVRAGNDNPLLNQSLERFVMSLIARNANLEFHNHPSGVHAFDLLNDDATSHELIARTIDFLKTQLGQQSDPTPVAH